MKEKKKNPFDVKLFYRKTCLVIYDIISVIGASYLALLMRYSFDISEIPEYFIEPINRFLVVNILITLAVLYVFKMYHSLWRLPGRQNFRIWSCPVLYRRSATALESSSFGRRGSRQCPAAIIFYMFSC